MNNKNNTKKKVIAVILVIFALAIALLFLLKGCQKEEPVIHTHSYKINEEGTWICSDDNDILSNTDKPYVAILENNQPKDILAIDSLSKTKINLGNGTIYKDGNNIYYSGNNAQTIIIKTQKVDDKQDDKDTLVINAPNDTVYHYGSSTVISLDAVATNSFHEYGKVDLITLTKARVVLENKSDVKEIYLDINDSNYSYETTIIALKENVELPRLTRDAVDLEEGEVKTLAIVQKLKDEVKTETNTETNEVIETILEVQTADDDYVKIENVRKSNDELIIEAFLSPNADENDKTLTETQSTSTVTLEEAKEGSSHPASHNTFVPKQEKVTEVIKPTETKEEAKQEETKPVVTPTKKEEVKPEVTPVEDDKPSTPSHTHSYSYVAISDSQHKGTCSCGDVKIENHTFNENYKCTKCGLLVLPASLTIGDGEELPFEYQEGMILGEEIKRDETKLTVVGKNAGSTVLKLNDQDDVGCTINITLFHDGKGTKNNPYLISNATQLKNLYYYLSANTGVYTYFKQIADIENFSGYGNTSYNYFVGEYDGGNHKIVPKKDFGKAGDLFDLYYGESTIKNLDLYSTNNAPIALAYSTYYVDKLNIENVNFYATENSTIHINAGNFGFVTRNPINDQRVNPAHGQVFNLKNVNNYVNVENIGNCTAAYFGSGCISCLNPSKGRTENCTFIFDNCHNYGNISSALYAGVVWGNGSYNSYFGPSGDNISDEDMEAMVVFENGGLINHATISAPTAHAFADGNVASTFILNNKYQNTIGGSYVTIGKLSGTFNVYFDGSEFKVNDNGATNTYIYKVALSVGSIYHYGTDWNVSNGRKLIVVAGEADSGNLFNTSKIHAYDKKTAVNEGIISSSESLDYKYECDGLEVALVVKGDTLYLIFAENSFEPDLFVDSAVSTYLYAYNQSGDCVGSIEIKQN